MEKNKTSVLARCLDELISLFDQKGISRVVAKQVFNWVYQNYVVSFDDMKNISKTNRDVLKQHFDVLPFENMTLFRSQEENAIKVVATLWDGNVIESVILKEKDYYTLCVSSQCGCPVDCKFCLTGVVGFKRNLTAAEIVGQLLYANHLGYPISNLVFMGMGEPMMNFEAVFKALLFIQDASTFDIGKRRVTVSTSGYIQGIKRLIQESRYIDLAFSVGVADPLKRARIMPIEKRNPIIEVSKLLKTYLSKHNRKLTLEYTLLEGVNDSDQDIVFLINLAKYLDSKVNLINLNPHFKIPYKPVSFERLKQIQYDIRREHVPVTLRYKKGQDISAACGQLGESHL